MQENQTGLPCGWRLVSQEVEGELVPRILKSRGYETAVDISTFLSPNFERDTYNHLLLKDIDKAVERIIKALNDKEIVAVYGDYDADGIPATALLLRGLKRVGFNKLYSHIPTRAEGYGLHKKIIKDLANKGTKLIITVDTGISAVQEVDYANSLGIDVIVTDHHEPVILPKALAIVNPKQQDCRYPNQHLSGTAVAYKLIWALYEKLGKYHKELKWDIDLVGISLVGDMMPLVGENRALTYYGLKVLRQTKNVGLQALMRVAGIDRESITEYDIAFGIAPRINALSRLAKEIGNSEGSYNHLALALLMTEEHGEALELAAQINQINQERKDLVKTCVKSIENKVGIVPEGGMAFYDSSIPVGISGLVAGEFSERSGWPCLILGGDPGHVRGSGRSPTSLSLVDLLKKHSHYLSRFGGHHEAAGFSVKPGEEENIIEAINSDLAKLKDEHISRMKIETDTYLYPNEANIANAHAISALAPFGVGNAKPLLLVQDKLQQVSSMRNGNHLRIKLAGGYPEAVWFNAPEDWHPETDEDYYLAVNLDVNDYFDQPRPQLIVKHVSRVK